MLGLIPSKFKLAAVLVLALVAASAVGYHFYKVNSLNAELIGTKADLVEAMANQAKLENAVDVLKQSQQTLERQRKIDQEKINKLSADYRESRKKVGALRKMLSKHDLGNLMLRKPGLLERRVNGATTRLGSEFEELTK